MSYTPPVGDAVSLDWSGSYSPPAGDVVAFASGGNSLTATGTLTLGGHAQVARQSALSAAGTLFITTSAALAHRTLAIVGTGRLVGTAVLPDYRAPAGGDVDFDGASGYTAPAGDAVAFSAGTSQSDVALQANGTLCLRGALAARLSADAVYTLSAAGGLALRSLSATATLTTTGAAAANTVWIPPPAIIVDTAAAYTRRPTRDIRPEIPWGRRPAVDRNHDVYWDAQRAVHETTHAPWARFRAIQQRSRAPWGQTARYPQARMSAPWGILRTPDADRRSAWSTPDPRAAFAEDAWIVPPVRDIASRLAYDHVDMRRFRSHPDDRPTPYQAPPAGSVHFAADNGGYSAPDATAANFRTGQPPTNRRIAPREATDAVPWIVPPPRDRSPRLPWGPLGSRDREAIEIDYPQEPPEDAPPELPASQRVYLVMPSIEAKRVSDNSVVWLNSARIRTDRDSWTWQLDAEPARREDRDAVKPTSSGPVELEVTINGHPWRFLVESHRRTRGHQGSSFSITGRSPSALLAAPYSAPATRTETTQRSAQQLATDELANTSWLLTWTATDWNVPASVYSYQGLTPIQSIRRIAEAIGAVAYTVADSRELVVAPYYVDSPWEWGSSNIDVVLTEDVILQIDSEWQPGPGYNAIFCSGRQQGVIVHVVRSNTAQDTEAEMVVDDLIVERLAGRERGRQELATAGDRERVTITLPMLPDPEPPGLVLPGQMVEVQEGGETWPGQVMATDVQANRQNAASVRQTIEVERWHG